MQSRKTINGIPAQEATSRYANILLDYWFKKTFGAEANKRLMILFLREIIPEADVQDISYGKHEHQNPLPDKRGVVFDIECTSSDGTRFIVEMQLARQWHFRERALFYSSFAIQEQIAKGGDGFSFMPVYFIALMDFAMHEEDDGKFIYRYNLIERLSGEIMTDRINFIFMELPKVKSFSEDSSDLEKLCYALHNMTVFRSRPPEMRAEIFELLFNSVEITKFTPEEKVKYEHEMRTEHDFRNQLAYSHDVGKAEGLAEGRIDGLEEARKCIAKKLAEKGFSPEDIAEFTRLES